ncbi:MAG: hypothetical protein LBK60_11325 [Verrucomicrobiales bacterium]|jgi:hypothetical protein|nr:hypothetical protein [Verrucomicrobiales bacterium]
MRKLLRLTGWWALTVLPLSAEHNTQITAIERGVQAVPATVSGGAAAATDQPLDLRLLLPQLEQLKAVVRRAGGTLELQINGIEVEELFVPLQQAFKVTVAGHELVVRPAADAVGDDIEKQRERLRRLIRDNARLEKHHTGK